MTIDTKGLPADIYVAWLRSYRCPECDTPMDEVPFKTCAIHEQVKNAIPHEFSEPDENELLEILMGRTGDD